MLTLFSTYAAEGNSLPRVLNNMHTEPRLLKNTLPCIYTVHRELVDSLEVLLKGSAVPHVLVWQQLRAAVTVQIVFLDTVVAEVNTPARWSHNSSLESLFWTPLGTEEVS